VRCLSTRSDGRRRDGAYSSGMPLVGRDAELERLAAALQAAPHASTCVVVEGMVGAGASALLDTAVATAVAVAAADSGLRVLRCRPTAAERHLAYAALADLLAPLDDLSAVSPVPRGALEGALLRGGDLPASAIAERAVATGCAELVQHAATVTPLLLAIDGAHELDDASAAVLRFVLRRLPASGVCVWIAQRAGYSPLVAGETMSLAPLPDAAIATVVRRTCAAPPSAPVLRAVVAAAGGNPLFATELARAVEQHGVDDRGVLPLPPSIEGWVDTTFGPWSPDALEVLAVMSCAPDADAALFERVGLTDQLDACEALNVVLTHGSSVRAAHPLLPLVAMSRTTSARRRAIHARLAAQCTDPATAAWHLARSVLGPQPTLAAELDGHAAAAVAAGQLDRAAELASLAATLTPRDHAGFALRTAHAAHLTFQQGDTDGALRRLDELDLATAPAAALVAASLVRATVAFSTSTVSEAMAHAHDALRHSTTEAERVEAYSILARVSYDHFPTAAAHALTALELAEHTDVPAAVLTSALVGFAAANFMAGLGLDRDRYRRAIEMELAAPVYAADSAFASFAAMLKTADELDEARTMLLELLATNRDDGALPFALSHLSQLELWAGNWDAAEEYAHRHLAAAQTAAQHDQVAQATFNVAALNAYRGAVDDAAALAEQLRLAGEESGDAWTERNGVGMLGLVALASGDAERAVLALTRWQQLTLGMGLHEPGYCRMRSDYVEALVATGRLEIADEIVALMRADADRFRRPTLLAAAARAQALLAAARGEHDDAVRFANEAVERYATTPLVLEHARALLTLGQVHRRFKEKAAARANLQAALAAFDRLGAERFAERARQDLARIGLRPPAGSALTETERRVAELAATGRTVRQVGDELFISPKTVEANLTRVYRKLGLGGRAELATWFATSS